MNETKKVKKEECEVLDVDNSTDGSKEKHQNKKHHEKSNKKEIKLQEEINKLNKEKEEAITKAQYAQAELINYRKRKDEEISVYKKYCNQDLITELIPVIDNFERAITMDDNNFGDETSKFLEGFRMVYSQTKTLLEKFEVKEVDCLGKEFDPAIEQAISTEKDESKPSGTILKVYQKGYMYKDKVLRLAMVIVNE